MAFGPISYDTGAESPLAAFNQGLQTGANAVNTQLQTAQNATVLAQQQTLAKDAAAVAANPTPQAIAGLAVKYPQLSDKFKQSFDIMDKQQQQEKLNQAIPIYAAVQNGKPEVAADLLNKQADAYENAGRSQDAAQARTMAKLVTEHPEYAKLSMGLLLAGAQGHEKFAETFSKIGEERRAEQLQPAKVAEVALKNADTSSQIAERAARLNLDRDRLSSETKIKLSEIKEKYGELKPESVKLVNDNVIAARTSDQASEQWDNLAKSITDQDQKGNWGIIKNAIPEFFGQNADVKLLRQEFTRLRSSGMLKMLPPGPASDNDMKTIEAGFPKDTDNAETITKFAKAMARLSRQDAAISSAQAEWLGANQGSLGKARTSMEIGGVKVPAGFSFEAFAKLSLAKKAVDDDVKSTGFFRFANPQPVAPSPYGTLP